ncbi:BrnA antitoxin family protein [uncultured Treponema sp.]|uniref:BrnA antitoxin family protein n=1 Tax=uncultured Treponema sp. TaxID=162155 RepID=UPI002803DACD|nr:BrnA antitoxin family protein [uncultured Treponema sp.]
MEIVKKEIKIGDQPTFDAIKEIEAAKNHEINYEDAPKLSKKELSEFVPANPAYYKPKKQQITLKLDADVIEAFKRLGKGYQTKINAVLRKAIFN